MNLVKRFRKARKLTIAALAEISFVEERELDWIERGGIPRILDAARLARVFECHCDDIFPGTRSYRPALKRILAGKMSETERRSLVMPEFDTDPRFWFLHLRLASHWRHFYVRSNSLEKIDSVLNVDKNSYLLIETCGQQLVLNGQHVAAYKFEARLDASNFEIERFAENEVGVQFCDSDAIEKFRFQAPDAVLNVFEQIEFNAPDSDPYIEFIEEDYRVGLASEAVAMMQTSLSALRFDAEKKGRKISI